MIIPQLYPMLATCLALFVYIGTIVQCGMARGKYGVPAPAVTGAEGFERAYRVQMNTLEQLAWFLPSLWLFSITISNVWGGVLGLIWVAGRIVYARAYVVEPKSRSTGFLIALAAGAVLLLGAFLKLVWTAILVG